MTVLGPWTRRVLKKSNVSLRKSDARVFTVGRIADPDHDHLALGTVPYADQLSEIITMFRFRTISLLATMQGPCRPSRQMAPLILELESRRLLAGQGTVKALVGSVHPSAIDIESHTKGANTIQQTKFVDHLYKKYLHESPSPAELSYALKLLATGVSHAALTRDFTDLGSKSDKKVSDQAFVSALYATIAGVAPTAVGQSYWQGLLTSGDNRTQVQQMFEASHGLLPPPTITWATPAPITYGTPLGPAQLNATASVPGTFAYLPPAGTILHAGSQTLIAVFTPSDTTDYSSGIATTTIVVLPAKPAITWGIPATIIFGTAREMPSSTPVRACPEHSPTRPPSARSSVQVVRAFQ